MAPEHGWRESAFGVGIVACRGTIPIPIPIPIPTPTPSAQPHVGRVPMSGLWRTARYLVFVGGNGVYGSEWRGMVLPEGLFTVFPSRFAGAVRLSPHFQRFSNASEAPSRWA